MTSLVANNAILKRAIFVYNRLVGQQSVLNDFIFVS